MSKRFLAFLAISCLMLPLASAYAQTTATIRGRVVDPQDAIVVGARVVARNVATGIESPTTTTSDGLYTIPFLASGTYDVRVEAPNFAPAETKAVKLAVGDTRDVNFTLRVGAATQVVEVTGEAPLVETTKTEGSTLLNDTDIARLPALSSNNLPSSAAGQMNDYATLAVGAPGVRFDLTGDSADLVGPGQFNNRSNQYNVDGANIGDITTAGRTSLGASVEEVREFQVLTNNYNAEYGQAGGLILNVVTKSGTNSIHGDFHEYIRGTNMEGIPYFTKLAGPNPDTGRLDPPPFFKHETGFTLGGPIIKDRTFWFVAYEKVTAGTPLVLPPPVNQTVTTGDDEMQWSAKIDHKISSKNQFSGRFSVNRLRLSNQLVQTPAATFPNGLVGDVNHDHTMSLALTSTLTTHVVNQALVVWHRTLGPQTPANTTLPGQETSDAYFGADFAAPQGGLQNRYTGSDNLTWTHGAHTLKAGVKMDYVPWNALFSQFFFGEYQNTSCAFPMTPPGGACPPATFTYGVGPAFSVAKDNIYAWFVQDSWKLKPNLTMNYGVRYDYEAGAFRGGTKPINGSFANGCFQSNGIIPACGSDKNNFQPRLGFAWSPRFDSGLLSKVFGAHDRSVISLAFSEITQLAYSNIALDSLNFDGVNLRTNTIKNSGPDAVFFNQFPNFPKGLPGFTCTAADPASKCGRIRPISPTIRNPETRNVQLTWQRELSNTMMISVGYLGSFGFGQFGEFDTNFPTILLDPAHSAAGCPSTPPVPGSTKLTCYYYTTGRRDSRFLAERTNFSNRNSAYNGLLVNVEKRYANHLQLAGNYSWSHVFSSTEGFYGVSEPFDHFHVRSSNRGPAETDARHLANFRMTVDTDNNRIHSLGFFRHVLNNWAFSLIGTAQSGRPWPISTGDGVFAGSIFPGFGNETTQAPNVLPNGALSTGGIAGAGGTFGAANYLLSSNGAALCKPTPAACVTNTFLAPAGASPLGPADMFTGDPVDFQSLSGNVGRNLGVGDPYIRGDISLRRAFRIPWREGVSVELRADLFNFANHTNFWQFNNAPNLSNMSPCGALVTNLAGDAVVSFTPTPGCTGGAGFDITNTKGLYYGNNGKVLTLSDLQHGRVSSNLTTGHTIFNGLGDPGGADIPRQAQFSIHVNF